MYAVCSASCPSHNTHKGGQNFCSASTTDLASSCHAKLYIEIIRLQNIMHLNKLKQLSTFHCISTAESSTEVLNVMEQLYIINLEKDLKCRKINYAVLLIQIFTEHYVHLFTSWYYAQNWYRKQSIKETQNLQHNGFKNNDFANIHVLHIIIGQKC